MQTNRLTSLAQRLDHDAAERGTDNIGYGALAHESAAVLRESAIVIERLCASSHPQERAMTIARAMALMGKDWERE